MEVQTMERRTLGKTSMQVSILGFGSSEIGYGNASVKTVSRLLGSALDAGLNVIDTAECYRTSEELIGKAVSHRRQDYYLFTKCGHSNGYNFPDWNPKSLESSIDRSLQRLRTDYLDLIQLHSCGEEVLQQGAVIEVLQRARDKGKTRYIGYSGDNEPALYAVNCGAFDTLQTSINIVDQKAITLTLPTAKDKEIGVIAKRPIANAAWRYRARPQDPYLQTYWERLVKLNYPFLRAAANMEPETALRFTLSIPGVHTAIVGTTSPGRWQQNAKTLAAGLLTQQQFDAIRARWAKVAEADWIGEI
jgi:aryl-alcohol dehydrogenase-like predicted oxidoreductase